MDDLRSVVGILKESTYIFNFFEKDLSRTQPFEKGDKIAIAIKMHLKCIFALYFITSFHDIQIAECIKRLTI